jgi:hypothetical protein
MFAMLAKETRPFAVFGALSALTLLASLGFMTPVLLEYFTTGLVHRLPTWVFSMALMMMGFLLLTAGLILDSLARARAEQLRLHYVSLPQSGMAGLPQGGMAGLPQGGSIGQPQSGGDQAPAERAPLALEPKAADAA